ncbi:hypothetical protein [Oscillatoria sp. FACHB-1406]|uniref:hypothetical protein n=1 Tax=Oscillatoria sp. FACHB-1406 TaxID=2692846 RepID=UPI0016870CC1|nr:hypothetical protein [Oscillatoria sp. FACHB-1406]MBD2579615.1 hypothetical protein [Oscillatoria sp. FACHB-1406]
MRVVTISESQSFLIDLLETVREEGLILQTTDGQQFVLFSLENWQGFDVGDSEDFEEEVKATSENKELIEFLAKRRNENKRVSMADLKKQLGLS